MILEKLLNGDLQLVEEGSSGEGGTYHCGVKFSQIYLKWSVRLESCMCMCVVLFATEYRVYGQNSITIQTLKLSSSIVLVKVRYRNQGIYVTSLTSLSYSVPRVARTLLRIGVQRGYY